MIDSAEVREPAPEPDPDDPGALSAEEAAARLGVKRATLYAYVSRGLIGRRMSLDGRTSVFDAEEIDDFRSRRRRRSEGEIGALVTTSITQVSDSGVLIRGRDLVDLVERGSGFEQVVEWLWGSDESDPDATAWDEVDPASEAVAAVQAALPARAPLIDRLRTAVATLSASDPLRHDLSPRGARAAGRRLIRGMIGALPLVGDAPGGASGVERLWPRLSRHHPSPARLSALEAVMSLIVDHGLATSTFGARVAASTRADPYSVVSAGLGVLAGPLHGAASAEVHDLLVAAEQRGDAAAVVGEAQRRGRVPGFGHSVYREADPRYRSLMSRVREAYADDARLDLVLEVPELAIERGGAVPNIDLALGSLTYLAEASPDSGEAVFAIGRTAGWIAHGIEEYSEEPLRFRARARYTGPRKAV